ncbi:MAG: hypothetical protein V1844_16785 [Pseudomonadota bacterium]
MGFACEYDTVISGPGSLTAQKNDRMFLRKLWKSVQSPKRIKISIYHIIRFVNPIFKAITNGDNGQHIITIVNFIHSYNIDIIQGVMRKLDSHGLFQTQVQPDLQKNPVDRGMANNQNRVMHQNSIIVFESRSPLAFLPADPKIPL